MKGVAFGGSGRERLMLVCLLCALHQAPASTVTCLALPVLSYYSASLSTYRTLTSRGQSSVCPLFEKGHSTVGRRTSLVESVSLGFS